MNKVTVSGKTVEDAVRLALSQLQTTLDSVQVTILEKPTKGFFGLGARPAVVQVELKPTEETERKKAIDQARKFLEEVLVQMGLDVTLNLTEKEDHVLFSMEGKKIGLAIGHRGKTLDALQYLTNVVANRHAPKYVRIILDAENYRARRKESLERMADRMAKKVIRSRTKMALEPMNPAERKIVHTFLQNYAGVTTKSEGEEPNRKVVIYPK